MSDEPPPGWGDDPYRLPRQRKPPGCWSVVWRLTVAFLGIAFVIGAIIAIVNGPQKTPPAATVVTTSAPTTSSYPPDVARAAFLSVTAELNTKYNATDAAAVNLGHAICTDLEGGTTPLAEAMGLTGTTNASGQALDAYDAGKYVGAAHAAFCP